MIPIDTCALTFQRHGDGIRGARPGVELPARLCVQHAQPSSLWGSDRDGSWFIEGIAGDMSKAWYILPYELPSMTFERFDNDVASHPHFRL